MQQNQSGLFISQNGRTVFPIPLPIFGEIYKLIKKSQDYKVLEE